MEHLSSGISISQAAHVLGTSERDVYSMMRQGQLPSRMVQGNRVLSPGAMLDYQARRKRRPGSYDYDRYL